MIEHSSSQITLMYALFNITDCTGVMWQVLLARAYEALLHIRPSLCAKSWGVSIGQAGHICVAPPVGVTISDNMTNSRSGPRYTNFG